MKKVIFTFLCFGLLIGGIKAEVRSESLLDACKSEKIDCVSKEKEDSESLPNVYLFRGEGCTYCNRLITFLDSVIDDYDVNVVVYEVTNNPDNWNYYKKIGALFDFNPSSYPYLVIGEETFDGYASDDDEYILSALSELVDAEKPYDVVDVLATRNDEKPNDSAVVVIILCAVIVMGFYLGFKIKTNN